SVTRASRRLKGRTLVDNSSLEPQQSKVASRAWGQPIRPERQAELHTMLDTWDIQSTDHGERRGPFHNVELTGAGVSWFAEFRRPAVLYAVPDFHLEAASLYGIDLKVADLKGVHLEGSDLHDAHLEGAHLEGAVLHDVHMQGASLGAARLDGSYLAG